MSTHPVEILISSILIKPDYYPRFQTDPLRIKEFVENMECGETYPPVNVAKDDATGFYVLLDGKHRIEAYKLRGVDKILAFIFPVKKEHWLMTAARFNSKSSKPLTPEEIKQIIIRSWENGIKDTDEIAREMGRTIRYIEMIVKPLRDNERNKREEKIIELHEQGMSQRKIGYEMGLSQSQTSRILNPNEYTVTGTFKKQNGLSGKLSDEDHNVNEENSTEKSRLESEDSKPLDLTPRKFDEDPIDRPQTPQIDFLQGSIGRNTSIPLVMHKRNDFVYASLGKTDKNIFLNNLPNESGSSGLSPMQVSTLAVNDKNESDESQNEVISKGFNEFDDDSNVDPPNIATSQDSDNDQNNESWQ
jgi:transcriptional regulator with XRE-family HTH domain